jgi:hypothetical protein
MINVPQGLYARGILLTNGDAVPNQYPAYMVATAGNVVMTPILDNGLAGADITFTALPAGTVIPFPGLFIKTASTAVVVGLV